MARFFFKRGMAGGEADASSALRERVRVLAALGEFDAVSVSEIACSHPECGDAETVILLMREGRKTEAVKILKAMRLVSDDDIITALAAHEQMP